MIELSGMTVRHEQYLFGDIEVSFTGLRPGEKLYEELLIGESNQQTTHPHLMKAREDYITGSSLSTHLEELDSACHSGDPQKIQAILRQCVDMRSTGLGA